MVENSESTQRLALHVPLLCSFRFLPAHVCRMQLPILEPRDCFSAVRLKCRQNSGTLGVMSCLGEGEKDLRANEKKTSSLHANELVGHTKQTA